MERIYYTKSLLPLRGSYESFEMQPRKARCMNITSTIFKLENLLSTVGLSPCNFYCYVEIIKKFKHFDVAPPVKVCAAAGFPVRRRRRNYRANYKLPSSAVCSSVTYGAWELRPLSHCTNLNKKCAELGILILLRDFLNNFLALLGTS